MKVKLKKTSPTYRQAASSQSVMRDLLIGVVAMAVLSVILQYTRYGADYGIKAAELYLVSIAVALITEIVWDKFHKNDTKALFSESFPFVTPIILILTLPIGTPLVVAAIASLIAVFFGKLVYGGFGQNIFNPALVGRVVVHVSFASVLTGYLPGAVDALTSATPITAFQSAGWLPQNVSCTLAQLFTGAHQGALCETLPPLVILAVGLILGWRRVLDLRITLSYLGTVGVTAMVAGIVLGVNPVTYALIHLCLGGVMFGAVFMATDPVTSPTSPLGKIMFGISLGFLTMLIRLKASSPEGCMYAILMMNMLTPWIESLILGRTSDNAGKHLALIALSVVIACGIIGGVSTTLVESDATSLIEEVGVYENC